MDKYIIVKDIYHNNYGKILKVLDVNHKPFIFKIVYNKNGISNDAIKEYNTLKNLNHANIIKLVETFFDIKNTTFILEYADMDLKHYRNLYDSLDDNEIKNITLQISLGLKYCHDQFIIHRDLKPQNILVQIKSDGVLIKMADFGLAIQQILPKKLSFNVVSLWYRAPEIILKKPYNEKIDIWSLGCIYYELITNKVLFKGTEETQFNVILYYLKKINLPPNQLTLINLMLKINPVERIDIKNIFNCINNT